MDNIEGGVDVFLAIFICLYSEGEHVSVRSPHRQVARSMESVCGGLLYTSTAKNQCSSYVCPTPKLLLYRRLPGVTIISERSIYNKQRYIYTL